RKFDKPITGAELAASIGPGLAKAALAMKVDGSERDLSAKIDKDAKVSIITRKNDEALELIRHDAAHVMAEAVQALFPGTPVTPDDLAKIEAKMKEIVSANRPFTRTEMPREDAIRWFKDHGEHYKAELIEAIPPGEPIGIYQQGDWRDLCR